MVKLALIPLAVVAALAPFAAAKNCKSGLDYCGHILLANGDYYTQIVSALEGANKETDPSHINNSLFHCTGGENGAITYTKTCSSCLDGGSGHSDTC